MNETNEMNETNSTTNPTSNACDPVAIIGFGIAGYNAAAGLRMQGYKGAIDVFSTNNERPYSPIMTSYYASGNATYQDCFPWDQDKIDRLGLTVHDLCPVQQIDASSHSIHTPKGTFPYSKCIIASGSAPVRIPFAAECAYGPLVLRTMQDAQALHDALAEEGCKRVLISGASMVAVKMLEAVLRAGKEATLVGRQSHILSRSAFPEAAERFERCVLAQGAELLLNNSIEHMSAIEDAAHPFGRILRVKFSSGEERDFDLVLVAHGMKGNLEFLDKGIDCQEGILVDEFMRSSDPDIYAAGDVAQATEIVSGERKAVGIFKNAALQGQCAGRAVAAEIAGMAPDARFAYQGSLMSNTITCNDALFLSAGACTMPDNGHLEADVDEEMTVVRLFEDDRLIGFNISCDHDQPGGRAYELSGMLTRQIREEASR